MSKRREELRRKVARGQARARGEAVPGLSPNPAANLIMANAIVRTGSILLRRAVDKRMLRGRYGKDTAEAAAENQGLGSTLTALALSKVAARSSTGAVVVGGGMLAKALYDRRQAKKARAKGDAQILEDAADA
ncbi:hypothetical protein AAG614_11310 [Citromicrobium bathyomarinum]|uniref:hypothetical protein n=1 Tax=Citromicrobium TaxID=72173 RepID=UPI0001DD0F0A|nr:MULTISPECIES: hypothetical protein [Citromicrobium]MAO02961.1 hypothetical protein [Citromicrobium sp.]ALG60199.1 hypothetical protein WG74_04530 [Citromicrobium sp. JL477]KPM14289.1 hypothetical protein WG75_10825 [Citromicrobium sp. WPS32]KPM18868.1 hypothetical protein VO58_01900 [Citromicrobium sp. JL1351]KPM20674.1 hypothetical protein VM77_03030 [Citromicrobium sp. JL31]|tara:strand:+ start:3411 stop:3809 length:399 start_codon:yes stop_codon:yes gene_type:complete